MTMTYRAPFTMAALLLAACTAPIDTTATSAQDSKTGDGPVAETASALGGGQQRTSACNGYPCVYELSWFGDHAHYVFESTGDNHVSSAT